MPARPVPGPPGPLRPPGRPHRRPPRASSWPPHSARWRSSRRSSSSSLPSSWRAACSSTPSWSGASRCPASSTTSAAPRGGRGRGAWCARTTAAASRPNARCRIARRSRRTQTEPMSDAALVLVTGATGYIGGRLVPELLAAGYRVRVLARHPERIASRDWAGDVEVAAADATIPRGPARAPSTGVDVAYYLIHALGSRPGLRASATAPPRGGFAVAARRGRRAARRLPRRPAPRRRDGSRPHLESRREVEEILLDQRRADDRCSRPP